MSVGTITEPSTLTFDGLRKELDRAYGYGIRPDKGTVHRTLQAALALTTQTPEVTKAELRFYQRARRTVNQSKQGVEAYRAVVAEIGPLVGATEEAMKRIQASFFEKTKEEQIEMFSSEAYSGLMARLKEDAKVIQDLADGVRSLLYTPVAGAKTDPLKNLEAFGAHRQEISAIYNQTIDLGNRQMRAALSITPRGLYASDTASLRLLRTVVRHPSLLSIPAGIAVAAAGAYALPAMGLSVASTAFTYGLGALIGAAPAIARVL
jgi:hypothetical protein